MRDNIMKFSVVIPARNEEKVIGGCLDAIRAAAVPYPGDVEVIVVLNRCTDSTESIARNAGAKLVRDDSKCLARIRNAGARAATGDILVTVDADSRMSPNMLAKIDAALGSGRFIGGGVPVIPERRSVGILLSEFLLWLGLLGTGLAAGLFWCRRSDFDAVGGFNEKLLVGEDLDLAKRLRAHGRRQGKRFKLLWGTYILTSCRKFDRFGDWFAVRMFLLRPGDIFRAIKGTDREFADRYFYDFEH